MAFGTDRVTTGIWRAIDRHNEFSLVCSLYWFLDVLLTNDAERITRNFNLIYKLGLSEKEIADALSRSVLPDDGKSSENMLSVSKLLTRLSGDRKNSSWYFALVYVYNFLPCEFCTSLKALLVMPQNNSCHMYYIVSSLHWCLFYVMFTVFFTVSHIATSIFL